MSKEKFVKADYDGILEIGDVEIPCYVLEDGRRVLSQTGLVTSLGMRRSAAVSELLGGKGLGPHVSTSLSVLGNNPIKFVPTHGGKEAYGYEATVLSEICEAILNARDNDDLPSNQKKLAVQADILIRSFAKVGIIALVDEATGFIKDKKRYEYRQLFKEFISEYARPWEKEFPDEFFDMVYDLYGAQRIKGKNHPQYFGNFIRKYVYRPLARSNGEILSLLDDKNPKVKNKEGKEYRKKRLHQFLNELGLRSFRSHLNQLIGIGKASSNKRTFESLFKRAFKIDDVEQLELELKD
jgi:hypothetical protein